jgi:hypothetical protein
METKSIARVNNVAIQVMSEKGRKLVPVKPICEALGVDYSTQLQKLKDDDFLSSVMGLSPTTGSDGKQYEMVCIPYKFVFGWLFTINPKNVKEESRESVAMYRAKCYDVLFNYFSEKSDYLEFKQKIVNDKIEKYEELRVNFKQAEKNLREAKVDLFKAKDLTYEEWKLMQQQQSIDFGTNEPELENEY